MSVFVFSAANSIGISSIYYFADVGIISHLALMVFSTYVAPLVALAFMLLPKMLFLVGLFLI
jgi:membrane-anchored protein YejM (alkaline phosphatase superfamily)